MRAYVLVKVKPQNTAKMMQALKDITNVNQASLIYGEYDCIIEVEAKDLKKINKVVMEIRSIKGVQNTSTCTIVHSWHRSKK